jgi:hypothetical protein
VDRARLSALTRERIRQANAVDPYYVLAGRDPARAPGRTATLVMVAATLVLFALFLLLRPDAVVTIAALVVALGAYYATGLVLVRRRR